MDVTPTTSLDIMDSTIAICLNIRRQILRRHACIECHVQDIIVRIGPQSEDHEESISHLGRWNDGTKRLECGTRDSISHAYVVGGSGKEPSTSSYSSPSAGAQTNGLQELAAKMTLTRKPAVKGNVD
jgi:hypothetical protein